MIYFIIYFFFALLNLFLELVQLISLERVPESFRWLCKP